VEELQVQILKLLLNNKDRGTGEASRYIFLNKFRKFLQENASNRGLFYNGKVDYFDLQRLGGLLSHLKKTLKGWSRVTETLKHTFPLFTPL
ncbi:hypothetical protein CRUP_001697, partial [Coryphaenoides rupestris]